MIFYLIMGGVVLIALSVVGFLFFMLNKEGQKPHDNVVPYVPMIQPAFEEDVYKKRIGDLEGELQAISQKAADQERQAGVLMEHLRQENESLKSAQARVPALEEKLVEIQGQAGDLQGANSILQNQLDSAEGKVRLLETELVAFKKQMGDELAASNATVARLKLEQESVAKDPDASLKETNAQLLEQVTSLEYEITKMRAQSSGLVRINENYKEQIETLHKNIEAVSLERDQLSTTKNRLEQILQEMQTQNEELVKRDKLNQFELEKSQSQLVHLERECADLKSKVPQ